MNVICLALYMKARQLIIHTNIPLKHLTMTNRMDIYIDLFSNYHFKMSEVFALLGNNLKHYCELRRFVNQELVEPDLVLNEYFKIVGCKLLTDDFNELITFVEAEKLNQMYSHD